MALGFASYEASGWAVAVGRGAGQSRKASALPSAPASSTLHGRRLFFAFRMLASPTSSAGAPFAPLLRPAGLVHAVAALAGDAAIHRGAGAVRRRRRLCHDGPHHAAGCASPCVSARCLRVPVHALSSRAACRSRCVWCAGEHLTTPVLPCVSLHTCCATSSALSTQTSRECGAPAAGAGAPRLPPPLLRLARLRGAGGAVHSLLLGAPGWGHEECAESLSSDLVVPAHSVGCRGLRCSG